MSKTKWIIDPTHSEITFKVKHLMITTVTGHFNKFNMEASTEGDDFTTVSDYEFTANIDSINTNNEQRDTHLKSADFFNDEVYPQLKFIGKKYTATGDNIKIDGDLTIAGKTQPITLDGEFGGIAVDGYGQTKAGFTINGKLSRKEFGLVWSPVTEAGNVIVGDEIKINAEVQLIKQA